MCVKDVLRDIALWTLMTLALCALGPDAVASGLIVTTPSPWVAATAMGLTLITVLSANQK